MSRMDVAENSEELTPAELDMRTRLIPGETQLLIAYGMLTHHPSFRSVIVPIALPDKQIGVWEIGQKVEHPNGFWFVRDTGDEHRFARDAAEAAATVWLGTRPGVAGWCVIRRSTHVGIGGHTPIWTVYEGRQHPDHI